MKLYSFISLAALASAAVNEPCIGSNDIAGVCISAADCTSSGGTSIAGACPSDPSSIKCCTKPACTAGNCRWASDCSSTSTPNLCPGPSAFNCCGSNATGFGGYDAPKFPEVGACKKVAVDGAKMVVAAWKGRVREVYCTRDCECGSDPDASDHCCGKATDLMCSDAGSTATVSGQEIAEWVVKNREELNLKYVIWGQRIWNPSRDDVTGWENWRPMDDRGSVTANHWDHVHVSYN